MRLRLVTHADPPACSIRLFTALCFLEAGWRMRRMISAKSKTEEAPAVITNQVCQSSGSTWNIGPPNVTIRN